MGTRYDQARKRIELGNKQKLAATAAKEDLSRRGLKAIKRIGGSGGKTFLTYNTEGTRHFVEVLFLSSTRELVRLRRIHDDHKELRYFAKKYNDENPLPGRRTAYETYCYIGLETGPLAFFEPLAEIAS